MKCMFFQKGCFVVFLGLLLTLNCACGVESIEEEILPLENEGVPIEESETEQASEELESQPEPETMPRKLEYICHSYRMWHRGDSGYYESSEKKNPGDPVVITSADQIMNYEVYTLARVEGYIAPFQPNKELRDVAFLDVWNQKFTDSFFETHDLLLVWMGNRQEASQYEMVGLTEEPENGGWQLDLLLHRPVSNEESDRNRWLFAIEVEKGVFSGEKRAAFPTPVVEISYTPFQNHYYAGEHGVAISNYLYEVYTMYHEFRWGIILLANQSLSESSDGATYHTCYVEVAYWKDELFLELAFKEEEMVTPEGDTVRVGYDAKGDWLWVDYQHPSGKYAAINYGATGSNAENLLEVVLTAELGN